VNSDSAATDVVDRRTVAHTADVAVAGGVIAPLVDFVGTEDVLSGLQRADLGWLALACLSPSVSPRGGAWQIVLGVAGIEGSCLF